jgi:F0F1-type ATP synthase assembly protein I
VPTHDRDDPDGHPGEPGTPDPHDEPDDPRLRIPDVLRDPPAGKTPRESPSTMSSIAEMGRAWGVALEFVISILVGVGLGWLFDRWQSTAPTGALIGLALGFAIAFLRIIRYSLAEQRREQAARDERKRRG